MTGSNNQPAPLTILSQYTSSPGRRALYYEELTVSSPAVAETVASTHGGMARLSGP